MFGRNVREFIYSLQRQSFAKVVRLLALLEANSQNLHMPYSRQIERDLWELRVRGQQEVRLFYCIRFGQAQILHGFVKKTMITPRREIEVAKAIRAGLAEK